MAVLLEVERLAQGAVWPLTAVHQSLAGRPCLVLTGWAPSATERSLLAKSLRSTTGLHLEVRLLKAQELAKEVPSCRCTDVQA